MERICRFGRWFRCLWVKHIFYVYAQRILGAARTSAYYAVAPFIGTLLSLAIFQEIPHYIYFIALGLMVIGA